MEVELLVAPLPAAAAAAVATARVRTVKLPVHWQHFQHELRTNTNKTDSPSPWHSGKPRKPATRCQWVWHETQRHCCRCSLFHRTARSTAPPSAPPFLLPRAASRSHHHQQQQYHAHGRTLCKPERSRSRSNECPVTSEVIGTSRGPIYTHVLSQEMFYLSHH